MKTPFQAYYIQPPRVATLPAVTVLPCVVTYIAPALGEALIEIRSLLPAGRVTVSAKFNDLASSLEKAVAEASRRMACLPPLPIKDSTATDEKSAVIKSAGAVAD